MVCFCLFASFVLCNCFVFVVDCFLFLVSCLFVGCCMLLVLAWLLSVVIVVAVVGDCLSFFLLFDCSLLFIVFWGNSRCLFSEWQQQVSPSGNSRCHFSRNGMLAPTQERSTRTNDSNHSKMTASVLTKSTIATATTAS